MKNKSILLNAVVISTILIFSSCSNKTEEICDCLKKAANTYMVKGEKAKEHDLMQMCNQFEGALKEASVDDKRIVETCLDTVKKHIEDKVLFTDIEQVSLPNLPCGEDFTKELIAIQEEKITKKGERKAMNYYLKNRELTCTIVVDRVVSDYTTEKPELYDGMIRVTGHLYDKSEILAEEIELLMPENEFKNIKKAIPYHKVIENAEYGFQDTYSQLIKFTGKFYEMPETAIGGILFMFKPTVFEYLKPNPSTETATFKGQPKFIFN